MKSTILKRSIVLNGHKTSFSLEDGFHEVLKAMATSRGMTVGAIVEELDAGRKSGNLSSTIRLACLAYAQKPAAARPTGPVV